MASGGSTPTTVPIHPSPPSWAQIASKHTTTQESSPLHNPAVLQKLKESTSDFIKLDNDTLSRARLRFQHSLFGKFFGKPPLFEQVKNILLKKWEHIGEIHISDLPNGFILIRCSNQSELQRLLSEGPWTINGIILQLSPWHPFFEPTFTKLTTAAIWIQLHNLPIEFWSGDTLETISSHLGRLLKIDDLTLSLTRTKYARICIELDLSKPLCKGFWLGDDLHRVFIVVLYERLPTFCYSCGVIGHGSSSCSRAPATGNAPAGQPPRSQRGKEVRQEPSPVFAGAGASDSGSLPQSNGNAVPSVPLFSETETDYGPWLLVSRRRGPSRPRGGSVRTPNAAEGPAAVLRSDERPPRGASGHSTRGGLRGGASGRRLSPLSTLHDNPGLAVSVPSDHPDISDPPVALPKVPGNSNSLLSKAPRDSSLVSVAPHPVASHIPMENSLPHTQPLRLLPKTIDPLEYRHRSPPPVLLSSIAEDSSPPANPNPEHSNLVDRLTAALDDGSMEEDSDQDDDESENSDDQMSEEGEPEDLMTLNQFQEEARRVALIRKSPLLDVESQKKGCLEMGESSHS